MSSPETKPTKTTWGIRGLPTFPVNFVLKKCPLSSASASKIMGRRTRNNRSKAHHQALLHHETESEQKRLRKKERRIRLRSVRKEDHTLAEALSGVKVGQPDTTAPQLGAPLQQTETIVMKDVTRRTLTGRIRKKDRERRNKLRKRNEKSPRMAIDTSEAHS